MVETRTRVVHCKREPHDVYIGRAIPRARPRLPELKWRNPYPLRHNATDAERREVIERYRAWLLDQPDLMSALPELRGKTLACWCAPKTCHSDVLVELLESQLMGTLIDLSGASQ